ncbi:RNA polymerase II transcription elongation factor-domain-containing protein [Xylaria cf. heliscus]|nr:RNA polymerase II transcription elongation factor-domain-containing protein [Xylaria cf. heliscus]
MASLAAGIIDPTKVGKYRVVLSDALLGKDPKELYTGIRYNHKPKLSSNTAPHQARIKPTGSTGSSSTASPYELSFQDDGGRYAYQGTRGHEENKYVLIFDPEKEVFVLHRVDSMFNMNLVRTPTNNDPEDLRQEHPPLEAHRPSRTSKPTNKASSNKPTKAKKAALNDSKPSAAKKAEPPKPAPLKKARHDSEDESSDDDVLTIEDPGGAAPASNRDFSPGFIDHPRRFSDFVEQQSKEEEEEDDDGLEIEVEALNDADGEEEEGEEEDDDDDASENFKLPSPIHRQMMGQNINGISGHNSLGITAQSAQEEQVSDEDEEEELEDVDGGGASILQDDMAVDLEAMLIAELEGEESDVSEEE